MHKKPGDEPLKSTGGDKRQRSRGFLSQPGGRKQTDPMPDGTQTEPGQHRSRGSRQISQTPDRTPRALADKSRIKRYRPEGK